MKKIVNAYVEEDPLPYLRFPMLDRYPEVRHGYSTRLGGVSTGYCSTMSFSVKCGDEVWQVKENFRRMAEAVGVSPDSLVLTDQVHGDVVLPVTREHRYDADGRTTLRGVDAVVTDQWDVTLVCFTADCVPLFFYDPVHKAIGLAHAGWRGTVQQIGRKTLEQMRASYGCDPADIRVVIGPSICASCYEVSEEVAEEFRKQYDEKDQAQILLPGREEHYQLDLWQANKISLQQAGVPIEQIEISGVCTCCHAELLHSHRATGGKRGLLTGYLALREANVSDENI